MVLFVYRRNVETLYITSLNNYRKNPTSQN